METRPILFNCDMVRAILSGEKTQTRRVASKFENDHLYGCIGQYYDGDADKEHPAFVDAIGKFNRCPFGEVGDRLWVRESFSPEYCGVMQYRATAEGDGIKGTKWTPSIHMPRWASRITLEITEVRVERLCNCSESDAIAEGITDPLPLTKFLDLWESIYKNVEQNPWVWVITFKRLESV